MKNKLVKTGFMYYPFARRLNTGYCARYFFGFLIVLGLLYSQHTVLAQSNENEAVESHRQGFMCQQRGDYVQAFYYYERAQILQPTNASFFNDMALMQELMDQKKEAESNYLKALSLDPKFLPAYANLGMFYAKQGQSVLAVQYLKQRVALGRPEDPWTLNAQEELLKEYKKCPVLEQERIKALADVFSEQIVEAKVKMDRAAARNELLDFEGAYQQGLKLIEARRFSDAEEVLATAVKINPRSVAARKALGRAQFGKEQMLLEAQSVAIKHDQQVTMVSNTLDRVSLR